METEEKRRTTHTAAIDSLQASTIAEGEEKAGGRSESPRRQSRRPTASDDPLLVIGVEPDRDRDERVSRRARDLTRRLIRLHGFRVRG